MTEIIGVRFKSSAKVYYFDPIGEQFSYGTYVIVETARGVEYGRVVLPNVEKPEEDLVLPLKPIIRRADEFDRQIHEENLRKAKDAMDICKIKIQEHGLDMKLVDSEYTFDNYKLIFYFTADQRVDFRGLVRDLAQIFRTRIELRQIGVRDHAKLVGGLGPCGQPCCCKRFMGDFTPVSIKMAKKQGLSLNPSKISGLCGRLMCCLNYEQEVYDEHRKIVPKVGQYYESEEGSGVVTSSDVLNLKIKIRVTSEDGTEEEREISLAPKNPCEQCKPDYREESTVTAFQDYDEEESSSSEDSHQKTSDRKPRKKRSGSSGRRRNRRKRKK